MYFLKNLNVFSWKDLMLGEEEWSFIPETILRTFIMFIVTLISLRIMGKRGVKQLSLFELVVIIGLGSAAGDPMFYKKVGILPAITVFIMIVILYSIITYFIGKNKKFELLLEGKPVYLIKNGAFSIEDFKKENLGEDEFFSELRMQGVSQLGQIKEAIEESSGDVSLFFYPDEEVKYGLPIMPNSLKETHKEIKEVNYYSCTFCGYTKKLELISTMECPTCKKSKWVKSSNSKRVN